MSFLSDCIPEVDRTVIAGIFETQLRSVFPDKQATWFIENIALRLLLEVKHLLKKHTNICLLPMLMLIPMTSFSAPMMGVASYNWYPLMILVFIGNIVTTALHLLAFRPLLKRAKKGWNLLFYATVFSVIFVLVQITFGSSEALNIVSSLLNLWLLFEVRELYKA